MPHALYYATTAAPPELTRHDVTMMRGGQHAWLIEGPGLRYWTAEIGERCSPILDDVIGRRPSSP